MGLAAVVGLVVEKMVERGREHLLDILWVDEGAIADRLGKIIFAQSLNVMADAFIFSATCHTQLREIVVEDRVETRWGFALTSETPHPDAVANQQMVKGAVQRLKEGTAIGTIISIGDLCSRVVEAFVAPGILAGEHPISGQHAALLR